MTSAWPFGVFLSTRALTVNATEPPAGTVSPDHVTTPAAWMPPALAETNVRPAGSVSVTAAPTRFSFPVFVTSTVNTTIPPTPGVGTSTDLLMAICGLFSVTAAEPMLEPTGREGDPGSTPVAPAVFVLTPCTAALVARAWNLTHNVSSAVPEEPPRSSVPTMVWFVVNVRRVPAMVGTVAVPATGTVPLLRFHQPLPATYSHPAGR